jgi:HYR domain
MHEMLLVLLAFAAWPMPAGTIWMPRHIIAEATSPGGAIVSFSVSGEDANGRPLANRITCSHASGARFPLGRTNVRCTSSDSGGQFFGDMLVTVVDTTDPVLTVSDPVIEPLPGGALVTFEAWAIDLVDESVPVECSPKSGSVLTADTIVACRAVDAHGNDAERRFLVPVQPQARPPKLLLPKRMLIEAHTTGGASVAFEALVIPDGGEEKDGLPADCTPPSGSLFLLGVTRVDCSGGGVSGSFEIQVVDTVAPWLDVPEKVTVEAESEEGARATFLARAYDLVDGHVAVDCSHAAGALFPAGETVVTCRTADHSGNGAEASFVVEVRKPEATAPARTVRLTATPDTLIANGEFVAIELTVTMSDDSVAKGEIVAVHSSEHDRDGRPDWTIDDALSASVHAQAFGRQRLYAIDVEVVDDAGTRYLERAFITVTPGAALRRR